MLTCVYHPIDSMRVVQQSEAESLKASGVWFDSPDKAKEYRAKVEDDIKNERVERSNAKKPKDKKRSDSDER